MKKVFKFLFKLLAFILLLLLSLGIYVFINTEYYINLKSDISFTPFTYSANLATIAEGKRLYYARGCVDCHGADLGGKMILDKFPMGKYYGSNLTIGKGGVGTNYDLYEFDKAVRHGVGYDSTVLVFMPSFEYQYLNNEDIGALYSYIKSVPAVDNDVPKSEPGPLFRTLFSLGKMDVLFSYSAIDHDEVGKSTTTPVVSVEYGKILAEGCKGCHGADFKGEHLPGTPLPAQDISKSGLDKLGYSSFQVFNKSIRSGMKPTNKPINPFMPWKNLSQLTDTEMEALWVFLQQQ